jgi:hypothetical protein
LVARLTVLLIALSALAACGSNDAPDAPARPLPTSVPIGRGPDHRPAPLSAAVRRARSVGRLGCETGERPRYGVHVELFGERQSAVIPAGIGVAPPWRGRHPYVTGGRCTYPLRTREPTGVIEVAAEPGHVPTPTLGELFELWGQPLTRTRAGAFRGRVDVWVGGRPWPADPRSVPLKRHAQIVVAIGGGVPVHDRYLFPPGL